MRLTPISQPDLIRALRRLGWEGPIYRSDHPFMLKEGRAPLKVSNPHGEDISVDLLVSNSQASGNFSKGLAAIVKQIKPVAV